MEASRQAGMRMRVIFWWWTLLVCWMNGCWCTKEVVKEGGDGEIGDLEFGDFHELSVGSEPLIKGTFYGKVENFVMKEEVLEIMGDVIGTEGTGTEDGKVTRWRHERKSKDHGWNVLVLGVAIREKVLRQQRKEDSEKVRPQKKRRTKKVLPEEEEKEEEKKLSEVLLFQKMLDRLEERLKQEEGTLGICCITTELRFSRPSKWAMKLDVYVTKDHPIYLPSLFPISKEEITTHTSDQTSQFSDDPRGSQFWFGIYNAVDKVREQPRFWAVDEQQQQQQQNNNERMGTKTTWDNEFTIDETVFNVRIVYEEKGKVLVVTGILSDMVSDIGHLMNSRISSDRNNNHILNVPITTEYKKDHQTKVTMTIQQRA